MDVLGGTSRVIVKTKNNVTFFSAGLADKVAQVLSRNGARVALAGQNQTYREPQGCSTQVDHLSEGMCCRILKLIDLFFENREKSD